MYRVYNPNLKLIFFGVIPISLRYLFGISSVSLRDMDDWIEVIPPKKAKRVEKKKIEERWKKLEKECPHIMTPQKIADVCKRINISNLENKLKSDEWISYQLSGWIYQKVLTNVEEINRNTYGYSNALNLSEEFSTLPLQNKWGDVVLFKRYTNTPSL